MSLLYGSNVKTHYIDPVFNRSKQRVEFRMPVENGLYLSNMRVMNIGITVDEEAQDDLRRYNFMVGSLGCIKNIYLYDGKQVLDQLLNFQQVEAFRNLNKSNGTNTDSKKVMKNHGLGYIVQDAGYDENTDTPFPNIYLIDEFNKTQRNLRPHSDESTTPKGYLNLQDVFPLLKNLQYVDGVVFKNLRVVMELTTKNVLAQFGNGNLVDTTQPLLAVDEILNEKLHQQVTSNFTSVLWNAIEQETVFLPEQIGGVGNKKQRSVFQLKGFDNKTVNSLFLQKEAINFNSVFFGQLGSEEMFHEKVQFVLNGSNLLPEEGLTASNQKLAMLTASFGNFNTILGSQTTGLIAQDNLMTFPVQRVSHHSYVGLMLNMAKVQELQLNYERDLVDIDNNSLGGYYIQALRLNVFAQVQKAIVKTSTGYQVMYV